MTTPPLKDLLIVERDASADDGKWVGGSHGRYLNSAWKKGFDAAVALLLPVVEATLEREEHETRMKLRLERILNEQYDDDKPERVAEARESAHNAGLSYSERQALASLRAHLKKWKGKT
jgi:hypothetical protein